MVEFSGRRRERNQPVRGDHRNRADTFRIRSKLRTHPTFRPRRVAMVSLHTSPLDQPGTGDAGGMNVYVVELARRLADRDIAVEIFTRATASHQPAAVELEPGVLVRHVIAGPFEGLAKEDLPGQMCAFARGLLRAEAEREPGWYDLVHTHYWLSGQVGALAKERWGVPLVHSMHTMAKVKNAALAEGDRPEPKARVIGEEQVVEAADRLVANADDEADQLRLLYGAEADKVVTINPGVDLERFTPGDRTTARDRLGLPTDGEIILFVGRIQPLKAPDVLVRAVAELLKQEPARRERLVLTVVGGPSGSGDTNWLRDLAVQLGVADVIWFVPPVPHTELVWWYRAASLVAVPSYNESFGLVALEAQACGTPVVAAATGGLQTAVRDNRSGVLLDTHEPADWATTLGELLADPARRDRLGTEGVARAAELGWSAMTDRVVDVYAGAIATVNAAVPGSVAYP